MQPKLIISLSHAFLTVPIETPIAPKIEGPIAYRCLLGWIVYGIVENKSTKLGYVNHCKKHYKCKCHDDEISAMIKNYFEIETIGTKPDIKIVQSDEHKEALKILETSVRKQGDRYESALLWKSNEVRLPESFNMALTRLKGVERKMARDQEYSEEYKQKINDYVIEGYARKLNPAEAANTTNKTFYLPHFGVKNPNKKGIRIVFDAAAETLNTSLNKCLLAGPDLNQPLITILFKFRQAPVAVCGDIKDMFHQIMVTKEDQDCQRFLWRGEDITKPPESYVMQSLVFGAACSPTIAQYVKNKNAELLQEEKPRAAEAIIQRHYVDEYVDCFNNEEEAAIVLKDVIYIHKLAGFELRKILSNSNKGPWGDF